MRAFIFSVLIPIAVCSPREVLAKDLAADLYQANCAQCHGALLQGAQGPSLLQNADPRLNDESDVARIIRDGLPEKGMPGWNGKISAAEITSLAQFIKERREENSAEHLRLIDRERIRSLPQRLVRSEVQAFTVELVAEPDKPTGLVALPDGRLLISQERGGLRLVERSGLVAGAVEGVPPCHPTDVFHRVLLGVALHPRYRQNGWIYLTCGNSVTDSTGKVTTEVMLIRGRLRAHAWVDSEILVHVPTNSSVGAPIAFDDQGHVFLTTASAAGLGTGPESKVAGDGPLAVATLMATPPQDLASPNGKILRYSDDGSIPSDNPFVGSPNAYGATWSLGIRNAAGLAFDSAPGQLWATDHGPRGGDKINRILKGHNYGWPVISYGTRYDGVAFTKETERAGMDQPVVTWAPDIGVSALTIYRGKAFPRWDGDLLVGSLVKQDLLRIVLSGDAVVLQEVLLPRLGRIRALAVGPKGEIYVALELAQQGAVVRLVPHG
jgi:aldose sugar dehydrogenase